MKRRRPAARTSVLPFDPVAVRSHLERIVADGGLPYGHPSWREIERTGADSFTVQYLKPRIASGDVDQVLAELASSVAHR
jgi:hypothetical protein